MRLRYLYNTNLNTIEIQLLSKNKKLNNTWFSLYMGTTAIPVISNIVSDANDREQQRLYISTQDTGNAKYTLGIRHGAPSSSTSEIKYTTQLSFNANATTVKDALQIMTQGSIDTVALDSDVTTPPELINKRTLTLKKSNMQGNSDGYYHTSYTITFKEKKNHPLMISDTNSLTGDLKYSEVSTIRKAKSFAPFQYIYISDILKDGSNMPYVIITYLDDTYNITFIKITNNILNDVKNYDKKKITVPNLFKSSTTILPSEKIFNVSAQDDSNKQIWLIAYIDKFEIYKCDPLLLSYQKAYEFGVDDNILDTTINKVIISNDGKIVIYMTENNIYGRVKEEGVNVALLFSTSPIEEKQDFKDQQAEPTKDIPLIEIMLDIDFITHEGTTSTNTNTNTNTYIYILSKKYYQTTNYTYYYKLYYYKIPTKSNINKAEFGQFILIRHLFLPDSLSKILYVTKKKVVYILNEEHKDSTIKNPIYVKTQKEFYYYNDFV